MTTTTQHIKNQGNVTHFQEKKQPIETKQMLKLADLNFKAAFELHSLI